MPVDIPLFVRQTLEQRQAEKDALHESQTRRIFDEGLLLSEIDRENTEFHNCRPVPLPLVELHGVYIRPFWRKPLVLLPFESVR